MRKLKGLLIVNGFLKTKKFNELAELFCAAAGRLRINLQIASNEEILPLVWKNEEDVDFVLFWDKDTLLASWMEEQGVPVFNSAECIALCDDKRKMHLAFAKAGIPTPQTVLAPMTFSGIGFTNYDFLSPIEEKLGYPMIVKEGYGSFGAQVYLAANREELFEIIESCSSTELLFQEYIEESRGRDIRLQVVGDRVVGSMYRYSTTDFRANISAGGSMRPCEPSKEEQTLAIQAARAVGADFAGVDLLFSKNGPLVCEVNSNAHFKNLMDCTGVDTAFEILLWIRAQICPLKAWLIYDREGAERNRDYIRMHKETGSKMGISFQVLMAEQMQNEDALQELLRESAENSTGDSSGSADGKPDFAIVRTIDPELSRMLEKQGIRIFNDARVSEICNDKGKTISYIETHTDVPVTHSVTFCHSDLTSELLVKYPGHVIKAVDGHGGKQVFRTEDSFERIRQAFGSSDFIIQPFVPGPGKDVRVYVIGNEIIAAVERTSKDGFRSNYSLGGDVRLHRLSEQEKIYVQEICHIFSFGLVGIDFLIDADGGFVFNEIEDVVGARMLYRCCPDIRLLERYFRFILEKILQ